MQQQREFDFADQVRPRIKIYLDVKYWIYCRDAREHRSPNKTHRTFYDLLKHLVVEGSVVCPIDEVVVSETFKQGNRDLRLQMGRLMDELSLGVCLKPLLDRVKQEILRFWYRIWLPQAGLEDVDRLVWTRAGFVLGYVVPDVPDELKFEMDSFVEHVWRMNICDVFGYFVEAQTDLTELRPDYRILAGRINTANDRHIGSARNWSELYSSEIKGVFSAFSDLILEGYEYVRSRNPTSLPAVPDNSPNTREMLARMVASAYLAKNLWREFPIEHILASLYAAIRRDSKRRIKENDFEDFRHAAAALPYCDAFFTERSLAASLNSGASSLSSQFNVKVIYDVEQAIAWLRTLDG